MIPMNIAGTPLLRGAGALGAPMPWEGSLYVVGLPYPNKGPGNRAFEVTMCDAGEPVELRREPRNPADPRAVAVYSCRGIQIGYLTAERCGWIGAKMEAGEEWEAIFQEAGETAGVIRVRFGGGAPTLPARTLSDGQQAAAPMRLPARVRAGARHDPDAFYPDPEPGEWGA